MPRTSRSRWRRLVALAGLVGMGLLTGCSQGGLKPAGREAHRIFDINAWLTIVGVAVSVLVLGLLAYALVRPGEENTTDESDTVGENKLERRLLIGGGIIMPAIVVAGFFGVQIASTMAQHQSGQFVIEVTGHQFWWQVHYRGVNGVEPFDTANEIHIPTHTNVTVMLRSDDVIHSFWVPQLAGKMDLIPGRVNQMVLSADTPGTYAGECAEYCGIQHAWMKFQVVAQKPDEFQTWAENQAKPAPDPQTDLQMQGKQVFLGQSCVGCHTIKGVSEKSEFGPDLTHLASRNKIGAGIKQLTKGNLTSWIANPQAVKPGVKMPPQQLSRDQLDALVAYLMSLE